MKPAGAFPPFAMSYTPQFPELLQQLGTSLVISTFQAGKLIFISPKDANTLIQLPRNFDKPMGFSFDDNYARLALACKEEIIVFRSSAGLAHHYPKSPATYDALYMPRVTYHAGALDLHDLHFGAYGRLYGVNTLFSCVATFDDAFNFTPVWMPPQITALASEDRCHLNGMAMQQGRPKYATAFNQGDSAYSWRNNVRESGVLFDIENNEPLATGLAMPHSPKVYNNEIYVLQSAIGTLSHINKQTGKVETVLRLGGFLRGMTLCGEYLFVSRSKLRKNASVFSQLAFPETENKCGIIAVHLPTASIAGQLTYQSSVDEIYDIHALEGYVRPNILNTFTSDYKAGLTTPEATYWAKPQNQQDEHNQASPI